MRGYAYDRRDVTGRGLANAYAQTLGTIFSSGGEKPYEVEIFVAEVGDAPEDDQIYRLTYDGQVADEHGYAVMGGAADMVAAHLKEHYTEGATLDDALARGGGRARPHRAGDRVIPVDDLEVAILDRTRTQPRKFVGCASAAHRDPRRPRPGASPTMPHGDDTTGATPPTAPVTDDPTDPTDQVSGGVPPARAPGERGADGAPRAPADGSVPRPTPASVPTDCRSDRAGGPDSRPIRGAACRRPLRTPFRSARARHGLPDARGRGADPRSGPAGGRPPGQPRSSSTRAKG